jgi:hypothetical protein
MSTSDGASQPRIARIWRGRTMRERADEYARYLYEVGIKPLEEKALGVQLFREDRETESEFVTISYWESVEAMSRFTGGDPTRIHHLDRDPEFLIELPRSVQILDIVAGSGRSTAGDKRAIAGAQPTRKRGKKAAAKARELAGQELDRLGDASLGADERERRKRRLTKGPSEFRDLRSDLTKPKP